MKKLISITIFLILFTFSAAAKDALITDFGAIADDGKPDHAAIQKAFDYVTSTGGGTVYFPAGRFEVRSRVATRWLSGWNMFAVQGTAATEILTNVPVWDTAFVFGALVKLSVKNLTIIGLEVPPSDPAFTDGANIFWLGDTQQAVIENVSFFNLAVVNGGAILRVMNSRVVIQNCQFDGNAAYYPDGAQILGDNDGQGNAWQSITVKDSSFIDYVNYQNRFLTKTPVFTGSYIRTTANNLRGSAQSVGRLRVIDSFFDEGAHTAINAQNTPFVEIQGVGINVNTTYNGSGIRLTDVKYATISQSVGDWARFPAPFLTTQNVGYVKVHAIELRAQSFFLRDLGNTNLVIDYCPMCK